MLKAMQFRHPELAKSIDDVIDDNVHELLYGSDSFKNIQKGY